MATLVLTALGTALGGPIGGAIGALAGQVADATILKPAGRAGPRLSDLSVQTSRYGAPVPRIFGTMRVAGTVIWSTDLMESSSTSGGKGQPSVTSYSYSASFAVALSSRPIAAIGRIWADGNLLRGAAGDFKSPVGSFRVYNGLAGQDVDPLIAAAVGADQAPAYRGIAYILLEDLQLADFGNRIPSLTVEVIADTGAVAVSTIASGLLDQAVGFLGDTDPVLLGYAADGNDAGEALAPLVDAYDLRWRYESAGVSLVERAETDRLLAKPDELRALDGHEEPPAERQRAPLEAVAAQLAVRHFDPDRDYQVGLQSAQRPGPGRRSEEIDLPAVLLADTARDLAGRSLRARLAQRRTILRACGWTALDLKPGHVVAVEGEAGAWIVDQLEWADMAARLSLRAISGTAVAPVAGDSGSPVLPPDLVQGPTSLAVVELAAPDDGLAETPLVHAAATGATAGWRRAALFRYHPDSHVAEPIGRTAPRAVIGQAATVLAAGQPWMFDALGSVDILLDDSDDVLAGADDSELVLGANLCALGDELLQFGQADLVSPGRYRLSRLVRGWRGTEWAMAGHEAGEAFVLVDPARLAMIGTTPADIGQSIDIRASGSGDTSPAEAVRPVDGRAILPPSPVHAQLLEASGDLQVSWTRRSRLGWSWRDLSDVPLGEEREAYRVTVVADGAPLREAETTGPAWVYAAADRASDLAMAGGAPISLEIRQIGTFGPSRPLVVALS